MKGEEVVGTSLAGTRGEDARRVVDEERRGRGRASAQRCSGRVGD